MNKDTLQPQQIIDQFTRVLRSHIVELEERFGVTSLGLFGSYVRGEQRENGDLDVLVEFAQAPGLFEFVELRIVLSDLLGVDVDLVMKRALKPRIGERILREVIQV